eukprot:2705244-Alexandrium_andersonii.AAC.1
MAHTDCLRNARWGPQTMRHAGATSAILQAKHAGASANARSGVEAARQGLAKRTAGHRETRRGGLITLGP